MSTPARGIVYLVGAGPGDPRLLTRRALELIATADVVAYDALISDAVLAEIGPDVEAISVGHRGQGQGNGSSRAAYRIHPDVIARARAGERVVRLKQGDPFIFGRGGEEAEELQEAGIAFEVVPGVSAALGAAAYAGIPLTHRNVASDVVLATGHDLLGGAPSATDWSPLARSTGTLVLFMAAKKLRENLERLVASGRAPSTPAAYVAAATTARQRTITGTLADLVERTRDQDPDAPALIIVGEVVRLRAKLAWIERRPLHGRRVLVARARPGESELARALVELGAEVIEAPRLDVLPLEDYGALDGAFARLGEYDGVVFGCAAGVDASLARLGVLGRDLRALPKTPFIAIGKQARDRLLACALPPVAVTLGACRDAVGAAASVLRSGHLLLLTPEDGRPSLAEELAELGAHVDAVAAYRLRKSYPRGSRERFDLIVVPSSSAARNLFQSEFGGALVSERVIAIGPRAEAAARAHGATRVARADSDTITSVVTKVKEVVLE